MPIPTHPSSFFERKKSPRFPRAKIGHSPGSPLTCTVQVSAKKCPLLYLCPPALHPNPIRVSLCGLVPSSFFHINPLHFPFFRGLRGPSGPNSPLLANKSSFLKGVSIICSPKKIQKTALPVRSSPKPSPPLDGSFL